MVFTRSRRSAAPSEMTRVSPKKESKTRKASSAERSASKSHSNRSSSSSKSNSRSVAAPSTRRAAKSTTKASARTTRKSPSPPAGFTVRTLRPTRRNTVVVSEKGDREYVFDKAMVNDASTDYANALNSAPLTPVIQSILNLSANNRRKKSIKYVAAPYVFVDHNSLQYENKANGYAMEDVAYSVEPPTKKGYDLGYENAEVLKNIIGEGVHGVFYEAGLHRRKKFAGLLGIQISSASGQHYVSYVYNNGHLAFFDSGEPGQCVDQETMNNAYIIIASAIRMTVDVQLTTICNTGTFETAAGTSEDDYNYIGQNIFCHSWSMWFIYQFVVEGKTMEQIDAMAGEGIHADRDNLWRIKAFVYETLIPVAKLSWLKKIPAFGAFSYYVDDPKYVSGLETNSSRRAPKADHRTIKLIPGMTKPHVPVIE